MFLLTAHYYCPAKEIEMRQKEEKPVALKAKKGKHYYLTKFIHVNKTCHSIIYCICCLPILPILPPPPPPPLNFTLILPCLIGSCEKEFITEINS